ncbi:MAG: hypothetical protein AAF202_06940 [Pseudomonadota bacterium]
MKKMMLDRINNEKGQAMIESIPLLSIFILLMLYAMGLFGVIHTGILFSIGARAYAFETFRNRANTNIFRYSDNSSGQINENFHHGPIGFRYHFVSEFIPGSKPISATGRRIAVGLNREPQNTGPSGVPVHNRNAFEDIERGQRNQSVEVDPAWLMIGYGLCQDASCGAQ